MVTVYRLKDNGSSSPMLRVRCSSELEELQTILQKNLDLIPGDQIDPEAPRRWLLVKREMPIPDPNSGQNRWSVDFFLLDQEAMPTFVECKRFSDTRSRREVVGQMLEYAANAYRYWNRNELLRLASESAQAKKRTLDEVLAELRPDDDLHVEEFFDRAEDNLREGQIRLIFFLEEAPFELKSIVEFLNRQMQRTEVLLVEARQYEHNKMRIVVPTLFGYSEEARQIKRTVVSSFGSRRKKWSESDFFEKASASLDSEALRAIRGLYEHVQSRGLAVDWGTGLEKGSLNVKVPGVTVTSAFTVWSDGRLKLNFAWIKGGEMAEEFRQRFGTELRKRLNWEIPDDFAKRYISLDASDWVPNVTEFLAAFDNVLRQVGHLTTSEESAE